MERILKKGSIDEKLALVNMYVPPGEKHKCMLNTIQGYSLFQK